MLQGPVMCETSGCRQRTHGSRDPTSTCFVTCAVALRMLLVALLLSLVQVSAVEVPDCLSDPRFVAQFSNSATYPIDWAQVCAPSLVCACSSVCMIGANAGPVADHSDPDQHRQVMSLPRFRSCSAWLADLGTCVCDLTWNQCNPNCKCDTPEW